MAKLPLHHIKQSILLEDKEMQEYNWYKRDEQDAVSMKVYTNLGEHSWAWYMEVSIRKEEGWTLLEINDVYNISIVIDYLKTMGAAFKNEGFSFLIKEEKYATLTILRYC